MNFDVAIVGAGVAGLCCARHLQDFGVYVPVRIIRCNRVDAHNGSSNGFLLDRGFQVMLTAYPEAQKMLDYNELNLGEFYSGALVRCNGNLNALLIHCDIHLTDYKAYLMGLAHG